MENLISHMGIGPKQMAERYADYPVSHEQQFYYTYEPATVSQGHPSPSKPHYGSGHKSNAAMSALTLLAFLFFLHILQQCIKDHMTAMSSSPVVIMSAGKDGNDVIGKTSPIKLDKAGMTKTDVPEAGANIDYKSDSNNDKRLMKIQTTERFDNVQKFKTIYKRDGHQYFADFVNDEK